MAAILWLLGAPEFVRSYDIATHKPILGQAGRGCYKDFAPTELRIHPLKSSRKANHVFQQQNQAFSNHG